jgi:hypothetical protein
VDRLMPFPILARARSGEVGKPLLCIQLAGVPRLLGAARGVGVIERSISRMVCPAAEEEEVLEGGGRTGFGPENDIEMDALERL